MKKNWRPLGIAKINQNGGVTLPAELRKEKSLKTGNKVLWFQDTEDHVILVSEFEYRQLLADANPSELIMLHLETLGLSEPANAEISEMEKNRKK